MRFKGLTNTVWTFILFRCLEFNLAYLIPISCKSESQNSELNLIDLVYILLDNSPEYSWNLIKHALLLKYWIILQTFWEDYPF